jgi:DNA-binding protein YbaB
MALDQSKVGQHMAEQMEAIEADFGDREGEYEIGDICTIVEIRGEGLSQVRMRPSVSSGHALLGLIKFAERQATRMIDQANE